MNAGTTSLRTAFLWILPLIGAILLTEPLLHISYGFAMIFEPRTWMTSAALVVPLVWRYRYPVEVFGAVCAIAFAQWLVDVGPLVADAAVLVALFSVCRLSDRTWALAACGIAELGVVLSAWAWAMPSRFLGMLPGSAGYASGGFSAVMDPNTFATLFGVGMVGLFGMYAATRRRFLASLEERAVRAEHERDQQAEIAAAAERARIAREIHDVIAHNVSAMVVYAEGGRLALQAADSGNARRAFDTIWETGREALTEMRRQLGVLREGDDSGQGIAPQPDVAQIGELVQRLRASGLEVGFDVLGVPPVMSPGLQLTIYRVVQESLTNVMKHAGPAATCRVMLVYDDDMVTVAVEDNGRGSASGLSDHGAGQGLLGMRERVAVYGGTVDAMPMPGGGFLVHARMPTRAAA